MNDVRDSRRKHLDELDKETEMKPKYECTHTDKLTCPYCGHVFADSWEVDFGAGIEGDSEPMCMSCGKFFIASRHALITYTSKKYKEQK